MNQLRAEEILREIRAVWQVDDDFSESIENGFHWWPGYHKVTVRCLPYSDTDHARAQRVTVTTEFVTGVDFTNPKITAVIASMASFAPTYSRVYTPPEVAREYDMPLDGQISFQSSVCVRPDTVGWLPALFAKLAIMQPIDAERLAAAEAELLGGRADTSGPRLVERGRSIDNMLNVAQAVFVPIGQEACRWAGSDEFGEIAERFGRSDMSFGTGGPEGLTLETPFGTSSALISLHHDIKHPALGAGLLSTIQLPVFEALDASTDTCMWLNFLASRSWTDVPVLGSWHPKQNQGDQYSPAYGVLVPNALYAPGLATNMALWSLGLVRWARQTVWPHLEDRPMHEILAARFGGMNAREQSS